MIERLLTMQEAADLGDRLEALCVELPEREREFLKAALRMAAADAWAHAGGQSAAGDIRELVLDIHLAVVSEDISLNPQPIPLDTKG